MWQGRESGFAAHQLRKPGHTRPVSLLYPAESWVSKVLPFLGKILSFLALFENKCQMALRTEVGQGSFITKTTQNCRVG